MTYCLYLQQFKNESSQHRMITDDELGNIHFVPSARARRISVRIHHDGLRVTLPVSSTREDAMAFIRSVRSQILSKKKQLGEKRENNGIALSNENPLKTLSFQLNFVPSNRSNYHFLLKDGVLTAEYPQATDIANNEVQKHLWNGITYFLRKEAKRLLVPRTLELARHFGFSVSDVKIQSSKSRWGSCSHMQSINLSCFLMLLPSHLVDYVILHELCHTKEMNHGANFWIWMDRVTQGQSDKLRKELKKYQMPKFVN